MNLLVLISFCATVALCAGFCWLGFRESSLLGMVWLAACLWSWEFVYELVAYVLCRPDHVSESTASQDSVHLPEPEMAKLIGQTAETMTPLRPSGYVTLDDRRYDAVASGEFVAKGTLVRISGVRQGCLIVDTIRRDAKN